MTVEDYPSTGHTMPPDEFAALDTQLIWSQAEPQSHQEPSRHGWASTIKVAAAAAAAVLGAIVAAAVMLNPPGHVESTSVTQTVTATTAASPSREADPGAPPGGPFMMPPPFTMPPDVPVAHLTHDGEYFQALLHHGWEITTPAQALHAVQIVCDNLAIEASKPSYMPEHWAPRSALAYWMLHSDPTTPRDWTMADAQFLVNTDATFYCPEYR
ncbi:MAG: DUF732 domain-containing protein [Mycobacterium sp.]|uniref:DUF732 domain-containing protein n=1 Tax=Mycobacterium sp. TaxID=1785 RepID=UPI003F967F03